MKPSQKKRMETANELIEIIAAYGRQFFRYHDKVSRFGIGKQDKLVFIDKYTGKAIYVTKDPISRGFTEGGTMASLVRHLALFIRTGQLLPKGILGPWPEWYGNGDPWGYGKDMATVRRLAFELGVIE